MAEHSNERQPRDNATPHVGAKRFALRLVCATVGGISGALIGAVVLYLLYGQQCLKVEEGNIGGLPLLTQGAIAAGILGALLGLIFGIRIPKS